MSAVTLKLCQHCNKIFRDRSSEATICKWCKSEVHTECISSCSKQPTASVAVHPKGNEQMHWGKEGRTEREKNKIGQQQQSNRNRAKQVAKDKGKVIGRQAANNANAEFWKKAGVHASTEAATFAHHAETSATAAEFVGMKVAHAGAGAGVGKAIANASANPLQAKAAAGAYGPNAAAKAALVEGIIEAGAEAYVGKAAAEAGFGIEHLGAYASAEAVTARAEVGIAHTPLQAHAQGPAAGAETGVSWDYAGGNVSASFAEARAGPFAARAGVKFGAGIRNGVPEVDLGPVSAPCSVM